MSHTVVATKSATSASTPSGTPLAEEGRVSQRLHIGGWVRSPADIDFELLSRLDDQVAIPLPVLAGHELVGVPLATVLGLVGLQARARSIVVESETIDLITTLPLEAIDRYVVVYRIGRVPLPYGLGGPFRLMSIGKRTTDDIKQLGTLHVSDRRYAEYAEPTLRFVRSVSQ
jgi:DMSO/TMAO reductase YedYZ molybdopterin-dependent catalytic subunit